jgi:hypothetical protein
MPGRITDRVHFVTGAASAPDRIPEVQGAAALHDERVLEHHVSAVQVAKAREIAVRPARRVKTLPMPSR